MEIILSVPFLPLLQYFRERRLFVTVQIHPARAGWMLAAYR